MIIDAFPFYNELDLLDIRLNELRGVVGLFVLVEAAETFSGKVKPLYFEENKERFAGFPIHHVAMTAFPTGMTASWDREHYTRDVLLDVVRGLGARADDILMISDADEIPSARAVARCAEYMPAGINYQLMSTLSYYYVNCLVNEEWGGSRMVRVGDVRGTLTELRYGPGARVPNGGWHFSYLGGVESIQDKLAASAHTEFDKDQFKDGGHLAECLQKGRDLLKRPGMEFRFVPVDASSFPRYLVENRERFGHLIWEGNGTDGTECGMTPLDPPQAGGGRSPRRQCRSLSRTEVWPKAAQPCRLSAWVPQPRSGFGPSSHTVQGVDFGWTTLTRSPARDLIDCHPPFAFKAAWP